MFPASTMYAQHATSAFEGEAELLLFIRGLSILTPDAKP
jgi:hypothetical protein